MTTTNKPTQTPGSRYVNKGKLKGDFARGERTLPASPAVGDFAQGEHAVPATQAAGDFASGEHTLPTEPEKPAPEPTIGPNPRLVANKG